MSPIDETEFERMKKQIFDLQKRIATLESVLKIERVGTVTLQSTNISIKGSMVDISSDASMKINGGGLLEIKGGTVKIN